MIWKAQCRRARVCEALRERKYSALRAPTFKNVHTQCIIRSKTTLYFIYARVLLNYFACIGIMGKESLSVHTKYIVMRQHDIESFHDPRVECILGNKANTARKWTSSLFRMFECVQTVQTFKKCCYNIFISNIGGSTAIKICQYKVTCKIQHSNKNLNKNSVSSDFDSESKQRFNHF